MWVWMIFEFQALEKSDIKFMPPFRGSSPLEIASFPHLARVGY